MSTYWEKFRTQRIARRRALQLGAASTTGLVAFGLVGCGSGGEDPTPTSTAPTGSTGTGSASPQGDLAAQQVVRRRITQDIIGMDPATIFRVNSEEIAFHIYSALTTYETTGEALPDAAKSWEVTDGGTTFIFHLNEGMQWHRGYGELTSEDVKYSYDRVMDPATGSAYGANFALIDSIETPDAQTVTIKLSQPDANFFHQVSNYHQGAIVRKEAIDELGVDYGYNPVGTGPFVWANFIPGQEVVLERFPEYFAGPATLERVILRPIPDAQTAAIAFQNEEVDILGAVTNEQTYERLETDDRVRIGYSDNVGHVSVGLFNGTVPYLDDPRVRKAFFHAVDRDAVVAAVAPLNGQVWHNIIPGWMDVFNPDVPQFGYDPETAKQLLSAAGVGSAGLSFKFLHTSVTDEMQFYQDYWNQVGLHVEFELVDEPSFVSRRVDGDYELSYRGLPSINPDDILFGYLHSDYFAPGGYNIARYANPEVDSLLEAARAEFDFETRRAHYFEAQALAMADAPYMPHRFNRNMQIAFKWIEPVQANPLTNMLFYPMKVYQRD